MNVSALVASGLKRLVDSNYCRAEHFVVDRVSVRTPIRVEHAPDPGTPFVTVEQNVFDSVPLRLLHKVLHVDEQRDPKVVGNAKQIGFAQTLHG